MDDDDHSDQQPAQYRYGDKRTWEIALTAVASFQRPVSAVEVRQRIVQDIPDFATANIFPDLSTLSVNCASRGNYAANRKPRRSDSNSPYDKLIKIGRGPSVLYDLYDPVVHGIWDLKNVGDKVLRPRFLHTIDQEELEFARNTAAYQASLNPDHDTRKKVIAEIVQREGQPAFRQALLSAYNRRCAISDCAIEALLEAAHIAPYKGLHTNDVRNGLLLRADLHKLFDLHLISIDVETRTLHLSRELLQSDYARFADTKLRDPVDPSQSPLVEALEHHRTRCGWLNARTDGAPLDEVVEIA